jgi:hypothetical protein
MESFRELFNLYKEGLLAEERTDELNRSLIGIWFRSPEDLNRDESDYTEDLIFELFAENKLEEGYMQIFREKIKNDDSLLKKYSLSKDLLEAAKTIRSREMQQQTQTDPDDEKEEAQLKGVLEEVIEKVDTEKEASPVKDAVERFIGTVRNYFQEFISSVQFNKQSVRLVMVVGSIAIIAGFAWLLLKPGETVMVADNKIKQPGKTNQPVAGETSPKQGLVKDMKEIVTQKLNDLVVSTIEHATRFDYASTRGESTPAADSFMLAADKYNEYNDPSGKYRIKEIDNCIIILNDLLTRNSFTDPDTISEISFFLGNCYLIKGIKSNSYKYLKLSLQSFSRIDKQNQYYLSSKWYSVFAYAKMGQTAESLRLCDTLMKVPYLPNYQDVKRMRDSIQKIIDINPD